jgi:integrase/recombinase XerD
MTELSPLCRRMIEDMKVRNLSVATQRCYVHAVAKFAQHFNRSPDRLGLAEIRAYQIHLTSIGASWAGFNVAVCALRFLRCHRRAHRHGRSHPLRAEAPATAGDPERRRNRAVSGGSAEPEALDRVDDGLRRSASRKWCA